MITHRYPPPSFTESRRAIVTAGVVVGLELVLAKFFAKPVKASSAASLPANGPVEPDRPDHFATPQQLQARL